MAADSQSTAERQLNLFIALFVSRRYLPKSEIRQLITGYHHKSDAAFDRMFERDKADLASTGVQIETGSQDAFFEDEPGYRIRRETVELPPIEFSPEELALLGAASRVWGHRGWAAKTKAGLRKLELAGAEFDDAPLTTIEPHVDATEETFEPMLEALHDRMLTSFEYEDAQGKRSERRIHPWQLFNYQGGWYVVAFDVDRDAPRVFRLSRIVARSMSTSGEPGAYRIPDNIDYQALAPAIFPGEPVGLATLRVRHDACLALRRQAVETRTIDQDWDEIDVPYLDAESLARNIASYGADVIVQSPEQVRAATLSHLRAAAGL